MSVWLWLYKTTNSFSNDQLGSTKFGESSGLFLTIWLNVEPRGSALEGVPHKVSEIPFRGQMAAVSSWCCRKHTRSWRTALFTKILTAEAAKSILEQIWCTSELSFKLNLKQLNRKLQSVHICQFLSPNRKENETRWKCFQILKRIIGWKNHSWVQCLSGALVFKRHFLTFFLVYYAAFSGLYLYSLIVILLLEPKNIQRSPEMGGSWVRQSDREAQALGERGVFSGKEEKQLLLAQWHIFHPWRETSPGTAHSHIPYAMTSSPNN